MTLTQRRLVALAVAAAIAGATAGTARAGEAPAVRGSFTMTSEPGDYIGGGEAYEFPARAIRFGGTRSSVDVRVLTQGSWWVGFATAGGERLRPGTYSDTTRFGDALSPKLDVGGDGRGCNESAGTFTIHRVRLGLHGYVREIHASFEQHCEDERAPALRGELDLVATAPPEPVRVEVTLDPGRVAMSPAGTGLRVFGTVVCNQRVDGAAVLVDASDERSGALGQGVTGAPCSTKPRQWAMVVEASNGIPFEAGVINLTATGTAPDAWYTAYSGEAVGARHVVSARAEVSSESQDDDAPAPSPAALAESTGLAWPVVGLLVALAALAGAGIASAATMVALRRSPQNEVPQDSPAANEREQRP